MKIKKLGALLVSAALCAGMAATATPNPAALSAVGATFEKEVDADED